MKKILLISILIFASTTAIAGHHAMNLTDGTGMTLYTFDKDSDGTSTCYGGCATNWPPYLVASGVEKSGDWGMIERKDGSKQWTFKGQPLYTWIGDQKVGDTNGDGVQGVWHIAKKSHQKKVKKVEKPSSSYSY